MNNEIFTTMVNKYSELKCFYEKECEILQFEQKPMSMYLFFEFVISDAIKEALENGNVLFIKNIISEIESLCRNKIDNISDIVICTVFDAFSEEIVTNRLAIYFGEEMKKLYKKYLGK